MSREMYHAVQERINSNNVKCGSSLEWLKVQMHPYFFITNADQLPALANLVTGLHNLEDNHHLTMLGQDGLLMLAQVGAPGSLYDILRSCPERDISYLQIIRQRVSGLPEKIKHAILASEISSSMVYPGARGIDYQDQIEDHLNRFRLTTA